MSKPISDRNLVRKTLGGQRSAFEELVRRYQHRVSCIASHYVSWSDVPDTSQETFIKAYCALAKFNHKSRFYTWLYRIAINTAKDNYVKSTRIHFYEQDLQCVLKEYSTPENLAATRELEKIIINAIENLSTEMRVCLLLRHLGGMSYLEIAKAYKCPIGTVRSRIARAREAIDTVIKPYLKQE